MDLSTVAHIGATLAANAAVRSAKDPLGRYIVACLKQQLVCYRSPSTSIMRLSVALFQDPAQEPTQIVLDATQTFSDAIDKLNHQHIAQAVWGVAAVKLVGIAPRAHIQAPQPYLNRVHHSLVVGDIFDKDEDCLVVEAEQQPNQEQEEEEEEKDRSFAVASRHFLRFKKDGIDYPVIIRKEMSGNRFRVRYQDYTSTAVVSANDLLPVTKARQAKYRDARQRLANKRAAERESKLKKDEKRKARAEQHRQERKRQKLDEEKKKRASKKSEEVEKRARFGNRLSRDNLPWSTIENKAIFLSNRLVYFTEENETVEKVAKKFSLSAEEIIYHNEEAYPGIAADSCLKRLTRLVLPPRVA